MVGGHAAWDSDNSRQILLSFLFPSFDSTAEENAPMVVVHTSSACPCSSNIDFSKHDGMSLR